MPLTRRARDDQGESLIELLIALTILGVCVIAIGSGIALSVKISAIHREQSTASAFLHNYAETLQSSYQACSGSAEPDYAGSLVAPDGFAAPTTEVAYWNPTTQRFDVTTCPDTDPGLQQVTLTLASADGFVSEALVVVVRKQ